MIALWSAVTIPLLGGETGVGLAVHHGIKAPEYQGINCRY